MGNAKPGLMEYRKYAKDPYCVESRKSILIIDSHTMFRELLESYLKSKKIWDIVGSVPDTKQALGIIISKDKTPDLFLLNMDFDMQSTLDFISQIKDFTDKIETPPDILKLRTVIMSDCTDYTHIRIAYNVASGGFLSKNENVKMIEDALIEAAYGKKYISKTTAQQIADVSALIERLLKKEQEVFALVQQGYSNADIAVRLVISKHSVENYLSALYAKFGVASREALQAL